MTATSDSPIRSLAASIPASGRLEVLEAVPTSGRPASHRKTSSFLAMGPNLPGALSLPIIMAEGPVGRWATSKLHFERHFRLDPDQAGVLPGWQSYRRRSSMFVRLSPATSVVLPHGATVQVPVGGLILTDRSCMSWPISRSSFAAFYRPLSWAAKVGHPALADLPCALCIKPAASLREIDAGFESGTGPTLFALCPRHAKVGTTDIWVAVTELWRAGNLMAQTLADGQTVLATR